MSKGKSRINKAVGRVYNLRSIFRRLNGLYFGGEVRARIEWGRARGQKARRSREFGTYYYQKRLIRVHPILDQGWVPLFVVEAVIHHEMCHQVCPEEWRKGRRMAHHAAFHRKEREYHYFNEAERWLSENLRKLLRPAAVMENAMASRSTAEQLPLAFAA